LAPLAKLLSPLVHHLNYFMERPTPFGRVVFNVQGHLRKYFPADQTLLFEPSQP
jgi:hypothetical protein